MVVRIGTIACLMALSSGVPVASAGGNTSNLSGDWIGEVIHADTPNGEIDYFRFSLEQTGTTLQGTYRAGAITGSITAGRVDLHLSSAPGNTYQAFLKSGEMVGTAHVPRGELKWHAYRDTSQKSAATSHDFAPTQFA